jgi:hypothetical protein
MRCGLSKSKMLSGLQCPKRLYLEVHQPELADALDEAVFTAGHAVGDMARTLYPGGLLIEHDLAAALAATREAMQTADDFVLFEPVVQHGGIVVRADILERRHGKLWLTEVKAAASIKQYHYNDVAIQAWAFEGAGYPLDLVWLAHVDTTFVYQGDGRYEGWLKLVDVTAETCERMVHVPAWALILQEWLAGPLPVISIGKHCSDPFPCPFFRHCSSLVSRPAFPLDTLPHAGKLIEQLTAEGYSDMREVPAERLRSARHLRMQRCATRGSFELGAEACDWLEPLEYPRYYLDFETISFAVPIWKDTRPYEQLPFQWSCHLELDDGEIRHLSFLDTTGQAPMRAATEALIAALGQTGPVFYYSSFDRSVVTSLAERFPDLAEELLPIRQRMIDLLPIAERYYYHPSMAGSWSLKSVLPTIAPELAYDSLDVKDGTMAQQAYVEMIDPHTSQERRDQIAKALKEYCGRDTLALVRLAHFLCPREQEAAYIIERSTMPASEPDR